MPGEHNINGQADGRGLLRPTSSTIGYKLYMHRDAWVRGKIAMFDNENGDKFYRQQILGNGVLWGNHAIRNITFRDIRFDAPEVTAAIRVGLFGGATGSMDSVVFDNIQLFGAVISMYVGETASKVQFKGVRIGKGNAMQLLTEGNRSDLVEHFYIGKDVKEVTFTQ